MSNDLSTTINNFIDAMAEQKIVTHDEIVADGKLHRIHVDGDKRGSLNGWYILHFDEKPAGMFGCNKRHGDHKFQWQSNQKTRPWTAEERRAWKARVAKERAEKEAAEKARHAHAAEHANAIWSASVEAGNNHPYLQTKGVKAHGLRIGKWEKVDQQTGEVRLISDLALLVPLCDNTRKIHSLQAIFPNDKNALRRNKDYLADGAKRGLFHAIGKPQLHAGKPVFVLCEGYATGASIHECTGHIVLVCFDAGNLVAVAQAIHDSFKAKAKECIVIVAADNDQWTTQPMANPGVHYASVAAKAVGGLLVVPPFKYEDGKQGADGKWSGPTDFNDLQQSDGADVVATIFDAALNQPEPVDDVPWDNDAPDIAPPADHAPEPSQPQPPAQDGGGKQVADDEIDDELVNNGFFTILGYDEDEYFFFHHAKKQILVRTARAFSDIGLIELAPVNFWEEAFPAANGGIDKRAATNWLFRRADARGIYDMNRVRGRGAWVDKGRFVFHHGDHLTVDGEAVGLTRVQSSYVYPMAQRMPEPAETILTAEEGRHLLEVAKQIRWSMPASAALLAGWTMLAPICGALRWRPHIWITGAAGSGKSSIQRDYCSALIKDICVYAQGESSEAGIRQRLKGDARPVLMDEAESNDDKSKARMEAILATIRQASTESQAETLKGTASGSSMSFRIRSMFCLASINTNLGNKADVDRLTKLVVRPPARDGSSEEHWKKLSDELHKISTDETIASRLLARSLKMLPNIMKNIEVFSRAASRFFGSQRDGDQFGTLLAGAWSLCSDSVATIEQADKMIARYEWKEHVEDHDEDDASRALGDVLDAKIRMGSMGDLTVFDLIRECSPLHRTDSVAAKEADATLRRHGIRVELKDGVLLFGTGIGNLKKLVEKSSYSTDLRGQLLRLPGASRYEDKPVRFNGRNSKCVAIPIGPILDDARSDADSPL